MAKTDVRCSRCGNVGTDDVRGSSGTRDNPGCEEATCLECGGGDFEEVAQCARCLEWFPVDEIKDDWCPQCTKEDEEKYASSR